MISGYGPHFGEEKDCVEGFKMQGAKRRTQGRMNRFKALLCFFLVFLAYQSIIPVDARCEMAKAKIIDLPIPETKGAMPLEESISKRRSKRSYSDRELTLQQIGQLLWSAQGITDERKGLRAAPSAGALYPLEVYLVKSDGLYHYIAEGHRLELIKKEDAREGLVKAAWGQRFIAEAPVTIVICAVYSRVTSRYGLRGNRYVDIEVGHAAQNVHLQAVALGLGSVPVGAYSDDEVSRALELPADHVPLYMIPVGYTK